MKKPVFIIGFPRSGTTLLRSIISQHSKISLLNEPEILWALKHAGFKVADKMSIDTKLLSKMKEVRLCKSYLESLEKTYLESLMQNQKKITFKESYEKFIPVSKNPGVWGEKSLNNSFFLKEISIIYPNAIIINVIRDPRSCIWSNFNKRQMKTPGTNHHSCKLNDKRYWLKQSLFFAKMAAFWSAWYQTIDILISKNISKSNFIIIKYEEFLKNPEKQLKNICRKIGIKYEEKILDTQSRFSDPVLLTSSAYAHQNLNKEIDKTKIYSYKKMPEMIVWVIEKYTKKEIEKYGYQVQNKTLNGIYYLMILIKLIKNRKVIRRSVCAKLADRLVDSDIITKISIYDIISHKRNSFHATN
jgi:hypothetical protein